MKVGIAGASGYAGAELLRLLAGHRDLEVAVAAAGGAAGTPVASHTPSLAAAYPSLVFEATDPARLAGLDAVFLALPHGESQRLVPELDTPLIVDLAADFRLKDPSAYPLWYGKEHASPHLLAEFVYGLPELERDELRGAGRIAVPGCYPTAAAIALAPFARAGVLDGSAVIVDAVSGVSGAGRAPSDALHFGTVDEDFRAYGLLTHRHTPEIEQVLGCGVVFTPHLAPMTRGILATCYARPAQGFTSGDAMAVLHEAYDAEPFVVVTGDPPSTKATSGSNCAHVHARVDDRHGWLLVLCALDNLVKGASGQAVQCANLALGLDEATGLPTAGMFP
ncbi:MAG: N-acetyl-gamma-glutamyl-phosphate reductase [Acidimicrobiales bacterium]